MLDRKQSTFLFQTGSLAGLELYNKTIVCFYTLFPSLFTSYYRVLHKV